MHIRFVILVMVSFFFAQVSCAMSEGYEIYLEASEHGALELQYHDASVVHDEVAEHGAEMPGGTHCVHSHPPVTFILMDLSMDNPSFETVFEQITYAEPLSLKNPPPLAPPKT